MRRLIAGSRQQSDNISELTAKGRGRMTAASPPTGASASVPEPGQAIEMYRQMVMIRHFEELALKLRDLEEVSSIFVTHRLQDIEVLANEYVVRDDFGNLVFENEGDKMCLINTKFIMLKDGNIIFNGSDEEMRNSRDPYIRKFLDNER